jgi:hypothetical protein
MTKERVKRRLWSACTAFFLFRRRTSDRYGVHVDVLVSHRRRTLPCFVARKPSF